MKTSALWCAPLLLLGAWQCTPDDPPTRCREFAVVRDLSGLDGCGYIFELRNGKRLLPVLPLIRCGTPPLPPEVTENPLYGFEFREGKMVWITYEPAADVTTTCMAGPPVIITCLTEVKPGGE